jgi:glycosyltransferase involved in cell wall biosynthesis
MDAKIELGLPTRGVLIGSVGRLSKEKGFDILIKAIDAVRRNGVDAYLAIAGEGDEYDSLACLIRSLGLEERCFLLGFCKDTLKLFQAFDVFALSSHREGLPNVILEAMALEVPIVATSVGSVSDVIGGNNPVSLVRPGDIQQMAESLTTMVKNSELRIQVAATGRQRVESHFSFSRRMERVAGVYNELLGLTSAADPPSEL